MFFNKIEKFCIYLLTNKSFDQSLAFSPTNFIFLKTFSSGFLYTKVWFTDQNFEVLEIKIK